MSCQQKQLYLSIGIIKYEIIVLAAHLTEHLPDEVKGAIFGTHCMSLSLR